MENRLNALIDAVESSFGGGQTLPNEIVNVHGYSCVEFRQFLHNLLKNRINQKYLEIGVYKGSTCIPALYENPHVEHWLIDNWAPCMVDATLETFTNNFVNLVGKQPNIISADCFNTPEINKIKDVDVYFYDGDHNEEDQYKAITHFYNCVKDTFILIVDDWNWADRVQAGTYRGIKHMNLKIKKQWFMSWHNGVAIFVVSK